MLECRVLELVVDGANHLEAKIRARESGDRDVRIVHAELADDVGLNVRRRGRGEREHRRTAESLGDSAEREIVGPEIVPPLADAMRFVYDEEADRAREQVLEERAILEALGGEIENLSFAIGDLPVRLAGFRGGEV